MTPSASPRSIYRFDQVHMPACKNGRQFARADNATRIVEIGALLRARAIQECADLNEAFFAVHAALWRLLRGGAELRMQPQHVIEATFREILADMKRPQGDVNSSAEDRPKAHPRSASGG